MLNEQPIPKPARQSAYLLPAVKTFIEALIADLAGAHLRRTRGTRAPSFARVEYLLHVHAGVLPPPTDPLDAALLADLDQILRKRGAP